MMDFVKKDLEKYKRAAKRAKALGMPQYLDPIERIIYEMGRIIKMDDDLVKGDVVASLFE